MTDIADDGPAVGPPAHLREPGRPAALPGTGRGLLGLRERVILHGGEFSPGLKAMWRCRAVITQAATTRSRAFIPVRWDSIPNDFGFCLVG